MAQTVSENDALWGYQVGNNANICGIAGAHYQGGLYKKKTGKSQNNINKFSDLTGKKKRK
jgi:hypothetical protein